MPWFRFGIASILLIGSTNALSAAECVQLVLTSPSPYQVIQREGFEAGHLHEHKVATPELGYADVEIRGGMPEGLEGRWQFRIVTLEDAYGSNVDWAPLDVDPDGPEFHALAEVAAGGWYRLDVRCLSGTETVAEGSVKPFGVGEIFLVAGQSYAGGYNDELLKTEECQRRVVAYDWQKKVWQPADDPQPHVGDGGTIWPALGDFLAPLLRVPVGFVNVSVGATSTGQWLPEGDLHKRLSEVGTEIGAFRAVLWQQGESDVIEKTSTEDYIKNMIRIRESAARTWQFDPTWLLAKSTLHPTVYNDPPGEERIRDAIHQLWKRPHFAPGPDTDLLSGENRGDIKSRRHFSGVGQRRAALLWFVAIWNQVEKPSR